MSKKPGLYANIHAKRKRGEKMRKPGEEGAPSAQDFKDAAKTAKKKKGAKREDPGRKMYDKEARYGSAKDCPKCKGDKEKCPGGKACPMSAKKDMGRKSPYADGMCKRGDIAAEFNAVLINDAERSDKPCGNSYIPQNAKCRKGAGQPAKKAGANSPEKSGGESVNAKGGYAKFLKKKGIDPSKLGANSPKAEKLAQEYYKTPEGKAEFKKPELSDKQKRKAIRKVAAERFKGVKTEKLKAALKANKGNKSLEGRTVQKAAKRELFNRAAQTGLQSALLSAPVGMYLESRREKKRR